jgi:hypothetical protein
MTIIVGYLIILMSAGVVLASQFLDVKISMGDVEYTQMILIQVVGWLMVIAGKMKWT